MQYATLGRTGLRVSVAGLGSGGHSRIGQNTGRTESQSVALVKRALDLGINIVDTAESYGTEGIIGEAIRGRRDEVVISTKKSMRRDGELTSPADLRAGVEASLGRLDTDRVEVLHLHGLLPEDYAYARETLVPELLALRDEGKILHLGVTEMFGRDCGHEMLSRAVQDDCWDVIMVGFNILNPSARERLFPRTMEKGIGTLCMFAVRKAFSRPDDLKRIVGELVGSGDVTGVDAEEPLAFLTEEGVAGSLAEAAYRFCRHEPGMDVVLTGTGSIEHLEQNVESILAPPLPEDVQERLGELFGEVDSVSGQ